MEAWFCATCGFVYEHDPKGHVPLRQPENYDGWELCYGPSRNLLLDIADLGKQLTRTLVCPSHAVMECGCGTEDE
jgi:hypothetical protein